MPKIAQYGEAEVTTQIATSPRARVPRGESFIAQGAADLATGIEAMGVRIDTTEAEEAAVSFEQEKNDLFFNPDSGYFNTRGKNALDGADVCSVLYDLSPKPPSTIEYI